MRPLFFAPDGHMRAGWRILLFVVVAVGALLVAYAASEGAEAIARRLGLSLYVEELVEPAAFLIAHAIMLWRVEHAGWSYAGLGRRAMSARAIALGAVLGVVTIAVPSAILLATGDYAIVPAPDGSSTLTAAQAAWVLVPAAFAEELLSRGYVFSALRDGLGLVAAIAITSFGFGALHAWNPGANAQSITVVVVSGFFLAAVLLYTGSLYAATAAHFTWNWTLGGLMHTEISGLRLLPTPDYRIVERGPDWLTGGTWGPEGGLLATASVAAATAFLFWRYRANDSRELPASSRQLPADSPGYHS